MRDVRLRHVSYQLLQPSTNSKACVTTTFIMEAIIRRTIVVVEEKVDGKMINRTVNEVRPV